MKRAPISSRKLQSVLDDCWTVQDLQKLFTVTGQSIHNWRKWSDDPLPALVIPGAERVALRFVPDEVLAWAKRHNIAFERKRLAA